MRELVYGVDLREEYRTFSKNTDNKKTKYIDWKNRIIKENEKKTIEILINYEHYLINEKRHFEYKLSCLKNITVPICTVIFSIILLVTSLVGLLYDGTVNNVQNSLNGVVKQQESATSNLTDEQINDLKNTTMMIIIDIFGRVYIVIIVVAIIFSIVCGAILSEILSKNRKKVSFLGDYIEILENLRIEKEKADNIIFNHTL